MPFAALKTCTYPGCTRLVRSGRCVVHGQKGSRLYPRDPKIQKLYNSKQWKEIRHEQLLNEPYCRQCMLQGRRVLATEVDHIEPHKGNVTKFFSGPFQSLCHSCHTAKTDRERVGV